MKYILDLHHGYWTCGADRCCSDDWHEVRLFEETNPTQPIYSCSYVKEWFDPDEPTDEQVLSWTSEQTGIMLTLENCTIV